MITIWIPIALLGHLLLLGRSQGGPPNDGVYAYYCPEGESIYMVATDDCWNRNGNEVPIFQATALGRNTRRAILPTGFQQLVAITGTKQCRLK